MSAQAQRVRKFALVAALAILCVSSQTAMGASKLIVRDSANTTDKVVLTDNGQIGLGLGTSPPVGMLHSKGNSYETTQILSQWVGTFNNGGGGFLGFHNNNDNTLPVANDRLGYFLFGSFNGANRIMGGGMTVKAEKTWSATSAPAFITFDTAPENSTTRYERIRITSNGNIGIGTSSPAQKLEIGGGLRLNTSTSRPTCSSTTRGTIWFIRSGTGTPDYFSVCVKKADENYEWVGLLN